MVSALQGDDEANGGEPRTTTQFESTDDEADDDDPSVGLFEDDGPRHLLSTDTAGGGSIDRTKLRE